MRVSPKRRKMYIKEKPRFFGVFHYSLSTSFSKIRIISSTVELILQFAIVVERFPNSFVNELTRRYPFLAYLFNACCISNCLVEPPNPSLIVTTEYVYSFFLVRLLLILKRLLRISRKRSEFSSSLDKSCKWFIVLYLISGIFPAFCKVVDSFCLFC